MQVPGNNAPLLSTLEIPIQGMDCADCTRHVQRAIAALPGVDSVEVYLTTEKAVIRHRPGELDLSAIRKAVSQAGYAVPDQPSALSTPTSENPFSRQVLTLLGVVFGLVLFVVVIGEGLGFFQVLTDRVPFVIGLGIVLLFGFPVFRNVIRAAFNRQIIAHTLMSLGVVAALAIGEWATAAIVVFFMRIGDYIERFTTERARRAITDLRALAPRTARLLRDGIEVQIPIEQVLVGETVVVRPGEQIPVDGEVIAGGATIDQSAITGESMPVEAGPGTTVYAATTASLGSLRLRATHIGPDSTFGRVIKMVEEAEANRGDVQRLADKFSAYYLPVVASFALITFILRRDPLATAAVLLVACSCSIALATPIAILASVGAGARHGLLIKGGKYLETLARADVLLIDKTGTLTLGKPRITDIVDFGLNLEEALTQSTNLAQHYTPDHRYPGINAQQATILRLAASAERYSEHPLAEAVRLAASESGLDLVEPVNFESVPGKGVRASLSGHLVLVGNSRWLSEAIQSRDGNAAQIEALEAQGKTLLLLAIDNQLAGALAASDCLRPEVPQALAEARSLGIEHIELLTGDNRANAAALAEGLGIEYQAELLPEEKLAVVRKYQSRGHIVVMVGDGINDAPALAQADIGIAIGTAGSGVAMEAAHVALLRDDWSLIPQLLRIAQRTMRVVKMNLGFTGVYNLIGLSLAALGFLPPIFAAALQSFPDLLILGNSSRLLKQD